MTWQDEAAEEFRRLLPAQWEIEFDTARVLAHQSECTMRVSSSDGECFRAAYDIKGADRIASHICKSGLDCPREAAYAAYHAYISRLDKQAADLGALLLFPSQVKRLL